MAKVQVRLRAMEPEDLDLLYRIENDVDLWAVGTTNVPYSRYTLHDYIATAADDIYADRQLRLIVESDGRTVGVVDLINFDPRHRRAEVGIVIEQPYRRQGYAQAAIEALHDYARRVVHLHQLYAIICTDNQPARTLFLALGYSPTATLIHGLLRSDNTFVDAEVMQFML